MKCFVGIVAALAFANEATAQLALDFVPAKPCTTNGGVVPLDWLNNETICELATSAAGRPLTNKFVSVGNWNALFGDDDGDGDFFEHAMGEMDAIALHPKYVPSGFGSPELFDFVYSSEFDFGSSWPVPVKDGSLWRLVKGTPAGGPVIKVFLDESVLQTGLGTTGDIDTDAVAFDASGTLYLSFRDLVKIHGDVVPVDDGGVVAFPPAVITYDAAGNITSLGVDTVVVVLNEPDVDALVAMIGLDGGLTTTIGDLESLDVDPAGGLFVGVGGILWPNLIFGGSNIGPRVLTTGSNIGAIALLNGLPLGDVPAPVGFWLGLDGLGSDVGSMVVIPDRDDPLCVDLEGEGLSNVDPTDVLWLGNGTPFGTALLIAKLGPTAAGSNFPSAGLGPQFRFPAFYVAPFFTILPLPIDPMGRIPVPSVFPPMTFDVNIIVQFADITFAPPELSAPVNIFFDA
jgi:hypothetical protein